MFDFNKLLFDFNYIKESSKFNTMSIELDDEDDIENNDIFRKTISSKAMYDIYNFKLLITYMLKKIDIINPSEHNIAYKEYINEYDNNRLHFMCCVQYYVRSSDVDLNAVFDYCHETNSLIIATLNTYRSSKWFNISYPLIKMISECKADCKIYIGQIHLDSYYNHGHLRPYDPHDVLYYDTNRKRDENKGIDIRDFIDSKESCSFFRGTWQGKSYYLPNSTAQYNRLKKNWPEDLKIPHSFIEHFGGFLSKHEYYSDPQSLSDEHFTLLYQEMFESKEDFAAMAKLLCAARYPVYDATRKANYFTVEDVDNQFSTNTSLSDSELAYKNKLEKILDESTLEKFELIKQNLTIQDLYKERFSEKNIYRKFNDNMVEKILLDNNVNIDKMMQESQDRVIDIFKKMFNDGLHAQEIDTAIHYGNTDINGKGRNLLKQLYNECAEFKYREEKHENECTTVYTEGCGEIEKYYENLYPNESGAYKIIYDFNEYVANKRINIKSQLLERFNYLLSKQCNMETLRLAETDKTISKSDISTANYQIKSALTILCENYNASKNYFDHGSPFNIGNIIYKINTYESLYKLCYFVAYAASNAYNNMLTLNFNIIPYQEHWSNDRINQEFTNDNPDMNTFNFDSLSKCFNTIFTNIAKRLAK